MPVKNECADAVTGEWEIGLCDAPVRRPLDCCFGGCCLCCAAYMQRTALLDLTGEDYYCCGGLCPCGPFKEPCDRKMLILESCCCAGMANAGNRYMVQTRFDRRNTPCDDYIIIFTCLASFAVCIAQISGFDVPDGIEDLVDCLVISVNGCMYAQQQEAIENVKKHGYNVAQQIFVVLPPLQQHMIQEAKPMGGGGGMGAGGLPAATVGTSAPQQQMMRE